MGVPHHIAVIPDGNRRWAKAHAKNPWDGHSEGVKRFWEISKAAHKLGAKYLTIWAGSHDNLRKRSKMEVNFLLKLLRTEVVNPELVEQVHANRTQFRVIGEWRDLVDKKTLQLVEKLEQDTAQYEDNHLTLLFGYDGQREMLAAINSLKGTKSEVSDELLRKALWTNGLPDVDYVIRTGGEPHWSAGFLMWLTANSEFYFTETLWPDFDDKEFQKAIQQFGQRRRKLGQ